ncbi:MAG: hypothetical protein HQK55_13265 [Deltaproteobacteria bacterium]|nr:hypothetical protein [Deltaproteobacteria bacterium]
MILVLARLTKLWLIMAMALAILLVACGPSRQEATKQVVTGLDGASSNCLAMFMTKYGDAAYSESQNLKPICVDYRQMVVTMSLEQKSGSAQDVAYRVRVSYVQPQSLPVTVYQRTYWFDQNDKESAEKKVQALVTLGANRQ